MDDLPIEVLELLFTYLSLSDQKILSLTCRRFYFVLSRSRFLVSRRYILREGIENTNFLFCDEYIKQNLNCSFREQLNDPINDNITPGVPNDPSSQRYNEWHSTLPLQIAPSIQRSLMAWCQFVTDLSFENCPPKAQYLSGLLRLCESLRVLNLSACNSLFNYQKIGLVEEHCFLSEELERHILCKIPGKTLHRISLAHISSLCDRNLKHLIQTFPFVRDFDLSGCFVDSDVPFHENNLNGVFHQANLSFRNFLRALENLCIDRFDGIALNIVLRLNCTGINDHDLDALCHCRFINLHGLFVDNCRNITNRGLTPLLSSKHLVGHLKQLSMGIPSPDVSFSTIASNLRIIGPNLNYINLSKLPISSKSDLAFMFSNCPNIEHLDISSCCFKFNSTSEYLWRNLRCISSLDLSGHFSLTDEDVSVMSLNLRNRLKYLNIGSCMKLTDLSLEAISVNFSANLEVLIANWCKGFSDVGLLGTSHSPFLMTGIYSFKRLKTLNFSDCHQITGHPFTVYSESYIPAFSSLTFLHLGRIGPINKDAFLNICSFAPSLQSLDISRSAIDDLTLIALVHKLKNTLRELFVSGCENLTNIFLGHLAPIVPYLRVLDISFCPYISEEAILNFQATMPYLLESKALYVGTAINRLRPVIGS